MADYLYQSDIDNYGPELIDVTQRAALQALSPHLTNLQQQNAALQQRLAVGSRRRLDDQVCRAVPDLQTIDRDSRWHRWLRGVDNLSGQIRQTLLNSAISRGDPQLVKNFFDQFKREVGIAQAPASTGTTSTTRPGPFSQTRSSSIGTRTYTPDDIAKLYRKHQQGAYANREAEWARIEQDIFNAQRENRIAMTPYLTK